MQYFLAVSITVGRVVSDNAYKMNKERTSAILGFGRWRKCSAIWRVLVALARVLSGMSAKSVTILFQIPPKLYHTTIIYS